MNPDVRPNEHGLLRELLRRFLVAELESSRGSGSTSGLGCDAGAALDSLLAAHRLDRRGRCQLCRSHRWWGRRRRVCMVFQKAHYWLRQPTHIVQAHLTAELGIDLSSTPLRADDPQAGPALSWAAADPPADPDPLQTPVVPSALPPRGIGEAGRSDLDHGGPGVDTPEFPRARRGPFEDLSCGLDQSLLTRGAAWPN